MAETTNNSLMKKTKAELIKIILRKDDVEVELQNTIKKQNETISDINKKLEDCINANTVLNNTKSNLLKENAELQNKLDDKEIELNDLNIKLADKLTMLNDVNYNLDKLTIDYNKLMSLSAKLLWSTVGFGIAFIISIIVHFIQ